MTPLRRSRPAFLLAVCALAACSLAGCRSTPPDDAAPESSPDAAPLTKMANDHAREAGDAGVRPDERSATRVLAYVNGEVVNYRDVLLRVGPQLAVVGTEDDRARLEDRALMDILRERVVHQAALEAGIDVDRDELDAERGRRIRELERNGATLDRYLAERGMTAREFDEQVRRELRMARYMRAAIGLGGDAAVRVRAITDTFPSPREIRAYYDRNPEKFHEPEIARVRVLAVRADLSSGNRDEALAAARAKAERAAGRVRGGEDFVPVFRDANRDAAEPDPNDGLLEIAERGRYADWIEEFAYSQPRGTVSDVVQKGSTFYLLRAEGHTPARDVPFEEVQVKIQNVLGQLKRAVAGYEVEIALLEEAAVSPRERYDALREFLGNARRRLVTEGGL